MKAPIKGLILKDYPKGHVTQWFGENPQLYQRWNLAYHNGIDIVSKHGTPIYAVEGGKVVSVKLDSGGFGRHVRIMAEGRIWAYAHLANIHVVVGRTVKAGDQIGTMGNTGFVISGQTPYWDHNPYRGTHLHLGVREYVEDPDGWRYGSYMPRIRILNYNNGVKGAIDPVPFLIEGDNPNDTLTPEQRSNFMRQLEAIRLVLRRLLASIN